MATYQNGQLWHECQLVAIWNAARFWGMDNLAPRMGSRAYRMRCRAANTIYRRHSDKPFQTNQEFEQCGLESVHGEYTLEWVQAHLPVAISIHTSRWKFHRVLIVEVKGSKVLLANYAKGRTHWMAWDKLYAICYGVADAKQFPPRSFVPKNPMSGGDRCLTNGMIRLPKP